MMEIFNNKEIGIYQIRNLVNNKLYIGSTVSGFSKRKTYHLMLLRKNQHHSQILQKSFNKHGENNFIFEIIEICQNKDNILIREQYWMDFYKCYDPKFGYNINSNAHSCASRELTDEHKLKISLSEKGKVVSQETKNKLSLANKGKRLGIKTGPLSAETRIKIGLANRGRKHTEETKKKISLKSKGRKYSEETKKRMSESAKGKIISEATKDKLRQFNLGKKHSEKTKKKISIARQRQIVQQKKLKEISNGN